MGNKAELASAVRPQIDAFFAEIFEAYPNVIEALSDMLDARADKGDPMLSLAGAKALRRKIETYANDGSGFNADLAEACLNYSAERGYPSVYPPKPDVVEACRRMSGGKTETAETVDVSGLVFI